MFVSVGPDSIFNVYYWNYDKNVLMLQCHYYHKSMTYAVEYRIDCLTNTFTVNISPPQTLSGFNLPGDKKRVEQSFFFFYVQGICDLCGNSASYSNDIELDMLSKKLHNVGVEKDQAFLSDNQDFFSVSLSYNTDTMLVGRHSDAAVDYRAIELPLVKIDLTDAVKAINKIKTIIIFS